MRREQGLLSKTVFALLRRKCVHLCVCASHSVIKNLQHFQVAGASSQMVSCKWFEWV